MSSYTRKLLISFLFSAALVKAQGSSGSGQTTRYWDCCKPSCAWPSNGITSPVKVCDVNDQPLNDVNAQSGCQGGPAYMCSDQSPWAVSDTLAYGFAAVSASSPKCCSCYKLTFTSTSIAGKTMIVQATNTGTDVGGTQFDLAIPGGGFGLYDGCTTEWGATTEVWGAQYGGSSTNNCPKFPSKLQSGCQFRWDWMQGADNPSVNYEEVSCPSELVAKSGCSISGARIAQAESNKKPVSSKKASPPAHSTISKPKTSSKRAAATTTKAAEATAPTLLASGSIKHPHEAPAGYSGVPVVDQGAAQQKKVERDDECDA